MMQTIEQVKQAVDNGLSVFWMSDIYEVQYWPAHKKHFVVCTVNQFATGLCLSDVADCYITEDAQQ